MAQLSKLGEAENAAVARSDHIQEGFTREEVLGKRQPLGGDDVVAPVHDKRKHKRSLLDRIEGVLRAPHTILHRSANQHQRHEQGVS